METFSSLLAICAGNSTVTVEFPAQSQWRGNLMFSLICVWLNGWVNNGKACDSRRHRGHYDVTVMKYIYVDLGFADLTFISIFMVQLLHNMWILHNWVLVQFFIATNV